MSDIERRLSDARKRAEKNAGGEATDAHFHIDYFEPPSELAPYVAQLYYFRCDAPYVRNVQPAALSHLVFVLEGEGQMTFADGRSDEVRPVTLFGPGLGATHFEFAGPFHDFGLVLTSLGFAVLTGKPANLFADRAVDAVDLFGREISALNKLFCDAWASTPMSFEQMSEAVCAFLLERVRPISPAHMTLIEVVTDWITNDLDPDVDDLYARLGMSRSTASRLIARYFGSPPKMLMRKYRALRAAALLLDPETTPQMRSHIESLFYDQPHMIREIRQFTGRTPRALDGEEGSVLRLWLGSDNYRAMKARPG